MKINFNTALKTLSGKIIKGPEEKDATLKEVCVEALTRETPRVGPNQKIDTGTEKMKWYELARKIFSGGIVNVTSEEISTIKERVGLMYSTMVVGAVWDILEGKVEPEEEKKS